MKVQELLTKVYDTEFNPIEELEVKNYIPALQKKQFVTGIIASCTDENDGFVSVDRFKMNIYLNMSVLGAYTNLEIATNYDEMIEQYDALCENGTMDRILNLFVDDYKMMCTVLEGALDELLVQNSIEAQVVRIANKISNILNTVGNNLDGLDLQTILPDVAEVTEMMKKLEALK